MIDSIDSIVEDCYSANDCSPQFIAKKIVETEGEQNPSILELVAEIISTADVIREGYWLRKQGEEEGR